MKRIIITIAACLSAVTCNLQAETTLVDALRGAAQNNPDFMAKAASLNAQRDIISERNAALKPQLSVLAVSAWDKRKLLESNIESGSSTDWGRDNSAMVSLDQVLFNPVFSNLVLEAEEEYNIAAMDLEAARLDLIEETTTQYIEVLRIAETVNLFQIEIDAAAKALEIAWTRYLDGTVREVDAMQAEARIMDMQSRMAGVQLDLKDALFHLESQTGLTIQVLTGIDQEYELARILPNMDENWLAKALETNPELLVANAQKALANQKVNTARKAFLPTFDFNLSHTFSDADRDYDTRPEFDRRRETRAAVSMSWNIYQGGGLEASLSRAKHERTASEYQFESMRNFVSQQVTTAARRLDVEQKRLQALTSTKQTIGKILAERRASYEAGLIDLPTLLEAERDWVQVVSEVKFVQYDLILALVRLHRFTGELDMALMEDVQGAFAGYVGIAESR